MILKRFDEPAWCDPTPFVCQEPPPTILNVTGSTPWYTNSLVQVSEEGIESLWPPGKDYMEK